MNSGYRPVAILGILVVAFYQTTVITSQIVDCTSLMAKIADTILKLYSGCSKEFMVEVEDSEMEYHRRIDCVMKCVMGKIGILDEHSKVTNDTMQVFFDMFLPEIYHEVGQIMVEGCIEDYSPLMDIEDETCSSYGEFVKCVQAIATEACG